MDNKFKEVLDSLDKKLQEVMMLNAEHLEKYAAAFFKEVGSAEASKYELVQRQDNDATGITFRWYFRLREHGKNH